MYIKKLIVSIIAILLCIPLCTGCSLQYTYTEDQGVFSYACAKNKAFIYEYRWDGTEEGKTIVIPKEYKDKKIVSIGGFYGRGLPMNFRIDISKAVDEELEWIVPYQLTEVDENIEYDFTVYVPQGIDTSNYENSLYMSTSNSKKTLYKVNINIEYIEE